MKEHLPVRSLESVEELFTDSTLRAIALVGDANQAKSNLIYACIKAIRENYDARIYSYGLRVNVGTIQIASINELEKIRDSVIFLDEFPNLFKLSNRKQMEDFEDSMRKIYHSNNIILLSALPHNFNKFLSALQQAWIFKQCTLTSFIQRSPVEQIVKSFSGMEDVVKGSRILEVPKDRALIYDPLYEPNFQVVDVPYIEAGDSKKNNPPILVPKMVAG